MDFDLTLIREGVNLLNKAAQSGELEHYGERGADRETILKEVLGGGLLPKSIGIGSGMIMGANGEQSAQTDVILYDALMSPVFVRERLFPSLGVKGTIEVKSGLSKTELRKSIDAGARFKRIVRDDPAARVRGPAPSYHSMEDGLPFSAVFAYSLVDNSLESLRDNLEEFETGVDPIEWLNLICVMNEGLILHESSHFGQTWHSYQMPGSKPIILKYGVSTFPEFYRALVDMLNAVHIKRFDVNHYRNPSVMIDKDLVTGDVRWFDNDTRTVKRLNPNFIRKIIEEAKAEDLRVIEDTLDIAQARRLSVPERPFGVMLFDPEMRLPDEKDSGDGRAIMQRCRVFIVQQKGIFLLPRSYVTEGDIETEKISA